MAELESQPQLMELYHILAEAVVVDIGGQAPPHGLEMVKGVMEVVVEEDCTLLP